MKRIAVLIPCYNEEKTIAKVVKDFKEALPGANIYVYDNNSTDETYKRAEKAGAIMRQEDKIGKGNVVRTMFQQVEADCYLMVDGDDTYPADRAETLCDPVLRGEADMVIGDRLSANYFRENKRRFHGVGNKLVVRLVNLTCKSQIKDVMSGYRAFSRSFVKSCLPSSSGFEIETEMTIYALKNDFTIEEVPVKYKERRDSFSKVRTIRDGARIIHTILKSAIKI